MKRLGKIALIVLAGLLVILAVAPLIIPIPPLKYTVPSQQLADPDSKFIEVNGLQVHYKIAGQGEPVMILFKP